jgi:hypothetical protein
MDQWFVWSTKKDIYIFKDWSEIGMSLDENKRGSFLQVYFQNPFMAILNF